MPLPLLVILFHKLSESSAPQQAGLCLQVLCATPMPRLNRQILRHRLRSTSKYSRDHPQRCPQCSRQFLNAASVLKHLNHPKSQCSQFSPYSSRSQETAPLTEEPEQVELESIIIDWTCEGEGDDAHPTPSPSVPLQQDFFAEIFPGSSTTFGPGKTFLDRFNSDRFALEREKNLYYPFSSHVEWEFASFLIHSGMSMKTIDSFFSLQMVGFFFLYTTTHCLFSIGYK